MARTVCTVGLAVDEPDPEARHRCSLAVWPAVRGTLALFGASSGPTSPVDPQRLNAAGSVYLTRPALVHSTRTSEEFDWRSRELFDAITAGSLSVTVSRSYPLADAAQAHRDLQGRRTVGSIVLTP
jgi:NADPH:quinone reductase